MWEVLVIANYPKDFAISDFQQNFYSLFVLKKDNLMKFNFKIQPYQTEAVESIVQVFEGQGYHTGLKYLRDTGSVDSVQMQMDYLAAEGISVEDLLEDTGYKNEEIALSDDRLLGNVRALQSRNNIKQSAALVKDLGRCSLDVEMETGTGKTYVYIKTMFELNKRFGWSKFIVVVPSIAIREGVKKSFEYTVDHFMEHYGKKARYFVYAV